MNAPKKLQQHRRGRDVIVKTALYNSQTEIDRALESAELMRMIFNEQTEIFGPVDMLIELCTEYEDFMARLIAARRDSALRKDPLVLITQDIKCASSRKASKEIREMATRAQSVGAGIVMCGEMDGQHKVAFVPVPSHLSHWVRTGRKPKGGR